MKPFLGFLGICLGQNSRFLLLPILGVAQPQRRGHRFRGWPGWLRSTFVDEGEVFGRWEECVCGSATEVVRLEPVLNRCL